MRISVQIEFDKIMDVEIPLETVKIGRDSKNDIILPHPSISSKHCEISFKKGVFTIQDLGSSNGTFVDGVKVLPKKIVTIDPSSQIMFGKIECEISELGLSEEQLRKAESVKTSVENNSKTIIRMSRLDLNKPSITLKKEKEHKKQRNPIRNPISEDFAAKSRASRANPKTYWVKLFFISGFIVGYLLYLAIP